jgi:hypothetical protein
VDGRAPAGRSTVADSHVSFLKSMFLKIMSDPDLYGFGRDDRRSRWHHETAEFRGVDNGFAAVLDFELAERKTRKEHKKAERAAG